jgi:hypothetical protein
MNIRGASPSISEEYYWIITGCEFTLEIVKHADSDTVIDNCPYLDFGIINKVLTVFGFWLHISPF